LRVSSLQRVVPPFEANKAMGLRSTVVLDEKGMSIGSKFGAGGTPMAVLVDAQGKIASELAGGAPAVLALAGLNQARPETHAPSSQSKGASSPN